MVIKVIILVVFVSFGGLFLLAGLAAAVWCWLKKTNKCDKKKVEHDTDIIHVDDHRRVKEAIVAGPHGPQTVVLEIDDDLHVDGVVRKDEIVGKVHGGERGHGHGGDGGDITEVMTSSSGQRPNV